MPYSKTSWADNTPPAIDAANLNNLETGVSKAAYAPDASSNQVPVGNGSGSWNYQQIADAQIAAGANIAKSKLASLQIVDADVSATAAISAAKIAAGYPLTSLAGYPSDNTKFARGDGTWAVPPGGGTVITSYRKLTANAVNATTAATDLLNSEINPAGSSCFASGKYLRALLIGDVLNNTGVGQNRPRFQFVLNGTTVFDTGATANLLSSSSRWGWRILIECIATSNNADAITFHLELGGSNNVGNDNAFTTGEGSYTAFAGAGAIAIGTATVGYSGGGLAGLTQVPFQVNVINGVSSSNYETKLYAATVDCF